jgi:hypothetical protein
MMKSMRRKKDLGIGGWVAHWYDSSLRHMMNIKTGFRIPSYSANFRLLEDGNIEFGGFFSLAVKP